MAGIGDITKEQGKRIKSIVHKTGILGDKTQIEFFEYEEEAEVKDE